MNERTLIELNNPHFDETIKVIEDYKTVINQIKNIKDGNIPFMILTRSNGTLVTISPENFAKIEFVKLEEGADE